MKTIQPEKVTSYWDAKSVLFVAAMIVGSIIILSMPFSSWYVYKHSIAAKTVSQEEEITLDVQVVKGDVLYKTGDTVALLAPAEYKIIRAAYGDNCWYNLTNSWTYGSGEDRAMVYAASEKTYKITCQELIGGEETSKAVTVIVIPQTEMHAVEATLSQY